MRLFLRETRGSIPEEVDLKTKAMGIVFSSKECKHLWKQLKRSAKKNTTFITAASPEINNPASLESMLLHVMDRVGIKRPDTLNLTPDRILITKTGGGPTNV